MTHKKNRRFKAIIITKKKTALILFSLLSVPLLLFSLKGKKAEPLRQYSSNELFYKTVISSALHTDKPDNLKIGKILSYIIGFDISEPQTILYEYNSQFYEVKSSHSQDDITYPPSPEYLLTAKPALQKNTSAQSEQTNAKIKEITAESSLSVTNATDIKIDINEFISRALPYSLSTGSPQVLIIHTHTTESYSDSVSDSYSTSNSDRSTDETKNMIAVGNALSDSLKNHGIEVIHDTTVHDYPAYNGSYNRSKATVTKNLEKYPTIKLVLDIHRDGIVKEDGTKVKIACNVDGVNAAQCMLVVGTDVLLTHNGWRDNMSLACKLQKKAGEMYPSLMRPINLREQRFNQQLSPGALIIEIGSNGNTLAEAVYSAKLMGNIISAVFGK